jgi:HAD superfamily hydrolase (TIGR01509 family)
VDRLVSEKRRRYREEELRNVRVFPGVREFVAIAAAECPLAISSGAARQEIEALLDYIGIRHHFSAIVGAEDVKNGKPEPDAYVEAVSRLSARTRRLEPSGIVAVEDTPGGITAARRAGLRVAAVLNTFPAWDLKEADTILAGGLNPASLAQLRQLAR